MLNDPTSGMGFIPIALAAGVLIGIVLMVLRSVVGYGQLRKLQDVDSAHGENLPSLEVIVTARNEERNVREAMLTLLRVDYPNLRIVAVNDRSTDATGAILDSIAATDSRLKILHASLLPDGWLGKNHALHMAAADATSEFLLFTDADILFDPTTLRRAMTYVRERTLDHLAIMPRIEMPGTWLRATLLAFSICFMSYFSPWNARSPRSRSFVGIGAFNLVRRRAYVEVGGYETIRMRPDDDMKLGKIIKNHGFRQDMLMGGQLVRVPWYQSFRELMVGLEKNAFSGLDYNVPLLVASSFGGVLLTVWPYVAVCLTEGNVQIAYGLSCLVLWLWAIWTATINRMPKRCGVVFPIAMLLLLFVQWRAMCMTFWNQGIRWRDTHYSLRELMANRV